MQRLLPSGILALILLTLSACATVETKGLPKCSGHDRRPLNADLWNWKEAKPGERGPQVQPLNFSLSPAQTPSTAAIEHVVVLDDQPRWNSVQSLRPCR